MVPAFSVIIPLYNKGPHVRAAVESALNQSLGPAEVIVIDDGSTDGGLEALRSIGDPRVKLLSRSPPGPGGYAARNLGIETATGDWMAFLDADDIWHKEHLESLATAIAAAGGNVSCAFAGVELVYERKREERSHSARFLPSGVPLLPDALLNAWLHTGECPLWTGSATFRRDLLISAGLFPAGRTRRGGDKDLWLRAIVRGTSIYTGRRTAEFHQDTTNRVSSLTPHTELPIICDTISDMLDFQPAERLRLLKLISNLEIATYARYSAGRGSPVFRRFARQLYYPEGLATLLRLAAYYAAGHAVRIARSVRRR